MKRIFSNRVIVAFCSILFFGSFAAAQTHFEDTIVNYFQTLGKTPQEKLYLHLDKPYYGAGEEILFKAYLLNAISHTDNSPSNFVYIELVNRGDSIIRHLKFKRDSLGFRGAIPLPADIPAGDYYLRGYTSWMQNGDPTFFYQRNLKIGNAIMTDIKAEVISRPDSTNDGTLQIRFLNAGGAPYSGVTIIYRVSAKDQKTLEGKGQTDADGILTLKQLQAFKQKMRAFVKFENDTYDYSNTLFMNDMTHGTYAVSFFPEGGNLLSGVSQQVAFKAQSESGFSLPVSGVVRNSKGETVSSFQSEHNGMGLFTLTPKAGEHYVAETQSEQGKTQQFPLPEVHNEGVALSMAFRNGLIFYNVQQASGSTPSDSLYLVAHQRGDIRLCIPLTENQSGKINGASFPDGIVHFLLINAQGVPLSERLLFIRHAEAIVLTVVTDKPKYKAREPIHMQIALTDLEGTPANGTFSLSVTDNKTVLQDSTAENILSSLLLTSDLQGYIENPGSYFNTPYNAVIQRQLDLVMLTHGWRRFKIENTFQIPEFNPTHFLEVGQTVSGMVSTPLGKEAAGATVTAYTSDGGFMQKRTDAAGRFLIDSISFNDSSSLTVQAVNHRGESTVDVTVDIERFPTTENLLPYRVTEQPVPEQYLANTRDNYYYEGGMRMIHLKEVVVEARQKERDMYASMAEISVTEDQIPLFMQSRIILDYLSTLTGVSRVGNQLSIRNNPSPPLILIDDVPYSDNSILERLYTNEVASVSVIKGANAAFFGTRGGNGVISIKRKEGLARMTDRPAPGVAFPQLLGFREITEFYAPVYDTPEKKANKQPDLRTTIYWNPTLQFDETGVATLTFYTADDATSYHVNIEGVTKEGYITRYNQDIGK